MHTAKRLLKLFSLPYPQMKRKKLIAFEKDTYLIDETPHLTRAPLIFCGLKNVTVEGNTFKCCARACFDIKDADGVRLENNVPGSCAEKLASRNSEIEKDF